MLVARHASRMIAATSHVHIARKPEDVFAYFADLRNEERWNLNHVHDVEMLTPEPIGKGSRFVGRHARFGRATWIVTAFDPPRHVALEGEALGGPYRYVADFAPDAGGTRMSGRMEWEPARGGRVLAPLLQQVLRTQARRSFQRFKEAMEPPRWQPKPKPIRTRRASRAR